MSRLLVLAAACILALAPVRSVATVITVRQDGTGDFSTIVDAVASASAADTIEVGPGTYQDPLTLVLPLSIVSADGPDSTLITGYWEIQSGPSEIAGFKFSRSSVFVDNASVIITNCVFEDSYYTALAARGSEAIVDVVDCWWFYRPRYYRSGAAAVVKTGARLTLRRCVFYKNRSIYYCAGVMAEKATLNVVDCLFFGNIVDGGVDYPPDGPGALLYAGSSGSIVGSTFYDNHLGTVELSGSPSVSIERCIFANSSYSIRGTSGPRSCNIYWVNFWGWGGWSGNPVDLQPDEQVISPLFCDPEAGDFSISTTSPAAPENSPCGQLIGAFAPRCTLETDPHVVTVRQDGTGDFTSIELAVFYCARLSGSTVEVGPGTYTKVSWPWQDLSDANEIRSGMTVRSTHGAGATVVDADGSPLFEVNAPGAVVEFEGLTLSHGGRTWGYSGGALRVLAGHVDVRNCIFEYNVAVNGGAVYAEQDASRVTLLECEFVNNHAAYDPDDELGRGGAAYATNGAVIYAKGCRFALNSGKSTALGTVNGTLEVDSCLFWANRNTTTSAEYSYGTVVYNGASGRVAGSTFYGNDSKGIFAGTIMIDESPDVAVERNVITGDSTGAGVYYRQTSPGPRSCNVYWDNAGGAIAGAALNVDEVEADPLFCDATAGDFTLSESSPAAPLNGTCSQLSGAFPVACNPSEVNVVFQAAPSPGRVELTWTISSGVAVLGYWIRREDVASGLVVRIPEQGMIDNSVNEYVDESVSIGREYRYTLFVADEQGGEHPSYPVQMTTTTFRVVDFRAIPSPGRVELEWEIDYSRAPTGYWLRREDAAGGGVVRMPEQGLFESDVAAYSDEDVALDREYVYTMFVVDGQGAEYPSDPVLVTTTTFRVVDFRAIPSPGRVELEWDIDYTSTPVGYWLRREDAAGGGMVRMPEQGLFESNVTAYSDENVERSRGYRYTLFVVDSQGTEYQSEQLLAVANYFDVVDLRATSYPGYVDLAWEIATDDTLLGCWIQRTSLADSLEARLPAQGLVEADVGGLVDDGIDPGVEYLYTLMVVDKTATEYASRSVRLTVAPATYHLYQNRPNPFNPNTVIGYSTGDGAWVSLVIFDVSGRPVRTLVDGFRPAGAYSTQWDGRNNAGDRVASGVYLYRLRAGEFEQTRKMVLLR